jgi:hypothetical protein
MTTAVSRGSATIYQFPVRGRFAAAVAVADEHNAASFASRPTKTVLGSAWYHDEAVEADRTSNN